MRRRAALEQLERRVLMSTMAFIGDLESGQALRDISNQIHDWNPDSVVSLGDNVHGEPTIDDTVGKYFHDYVAPYHGHYGDGSSSGNRFYSALGNHDYDDNGINDYKNFFSFPGNERYYSVRDGNVELFVVNSNDEEPDGISSGSDQARWLKNALASSTATWKLVAFHYPAYTSGTEGDHDFMRWPFKQWGATAVLSSHDHLYERLSEDGLPYFVNGLGGAPIVRPLRVEAGSRVRYAGDFGFMRVESSAQAINFKFITRSGEVKDDYTIESATPPPTPPPPTPPPPTPPPPTPDPVPPTPTPDPPTVPAAEMTLNARGTLIATTTDSPDHVSLSLRKRDGRLILRVNDLARSFAPSRVKRIAVFTLGGDDLVVIGSDVRGSYVDGGAGNDTINGGAGGDVLIGGAGKDRLIGMDGDDTLVGGAGNDYLLGGAGKDRLFGNDGSDTLSGAGGSDYLDGGQQADVLRGGPAVDSVRRDESDSAEDHLEIELA